MFHAKEAQRAPTPRGRLGEGKFKPSKGIANGNIVALVDRDCYSYLLVMKSVNSLLIYQRKLKSNNVVNFGREERILQGRRHRQVPDDVTLSPKVIAGHPLRSVLS
jgi:hypothetical protein